MSCLFISKETVSGTARSCAFDLKDYIHIYERASATAAHSCCLPKINNREHVSMMLEPGQPRAENWERPRLAAAATEQLLLGSRRLRVAFLQTSQRFAGRDTLLLRAGMSEPAAILIRSGFAHYTCTMSDGRRAILHVLLSGDFAGLHNIVLARAMEDLYAANRVGYHVLGAAVLRELLADPCVSMFVLAQIAEARWRGDRLTASIGRLDAHARICVLLLDIHDRLRHRGLINRPTFNLPLTQEQIADHLGLTLVHVNRTLRRLREERIVLVDRQVVIIQDTARMRELAQGLPQPAELPETPLGPERALEYSPPPPERPSERVVTAEFGN
jgi:CRP/FNR family transcriptional regulator, anaerobic regulatory protein